VKAWKAWKTAANGAGAHFLKSAWPSPQWLPALPNVSRGRDEGVDGVHVPINPDDLPVGTDIASNESIQDQAGCAPDPGRHVLEEWTEGQHDAEMC
jgi:hypothetical protein